MDEESIQSSGFSRTPSGAARRFFGTFRRFLERWEPERREPSFADEGSPEGLSDRPNEPSADLRSRAAQEIGAYTEDNAALIDRAVRFGERSRRLNEEGTPSESARNRAARARSEVRANLARIRETFAASSEDRESAARAFDLELAARLLGFDSPQGGQ